MEYFVRIQLVVNHFALNFQIIKHYTESELSPEISSFFVGLHSFQRIDHPLKHFLSKFVRAERKKEREGRWKETKTSFAVEVSSLCANKPIIIKSV